MKTVLLLTVSFLITFSRCSHAMPRQPGIDLRRLFQAFEAQLFPTVRFEDKVNQIVNCLSLFFFFLHLIKNFCYSCGSHSGVTTSNRQSAQSSSINVVIKTYWASSCNETWNTCESLFSLATCWYLTLVRPSRVAKRALSVQHENIAGRWSWRARKIKYSWK